ncbi:EcsC family protein [Arsenicicoccus dermatophilus]|uniref:EcsC family protein n=1 Tax=Arsenicicoccus dermatophilus TaxID=1076331 RepID=UPI0039176074
MSTYPSQMSEYERRRWQELQEHWDRKSRRRQILPERAHRAAEKAGTATRQAAGKAGTKIVEMTPDKVKESAGVVLDAALLPTAEALVHTLELVNDWAVELSDPQSVLDHHSKAGRDVSTLSDLKTLDLEVLDEVTRGMALRWRTLGSAEGAALGALAMLPVPVVGSALAISADAIAMQVLSTAIATRVCYAYGFDPHDERAQQMINRMIARAYKQQAPKAGTVKKAEAAFAAAEGRVKWSNQLRNNHKLLEAVENLLKKLSNGQRVPVQNARMGMPVISVVTGAGTNAYVLGDVAQQARRYATTILLAEKYGLHLPDGLANSVAGGNLERE